MDGDEKSPETILEHDRILWFGDLNYRIALSYRSAMEMGNSKALLEKDQLHIEQRCGHVFEGWKEGRIYFPPTYKYSNNSNRYAGDDMHPKEKRRTLAWCDRILCVTTKDSSLGASSFFYKTCQFHLQMGMRKLVNHCMPFVIKGNKKRGNPLPLIQRTRVHSNSIANRVFNNNCQLSLWNQVFMRLSNNQD